MVGRLVGKRYVVLGIAVVNGMEWIELGLTEVILWYGMEWHIHVFAAVNGV